MKKNSKKLTCLLLAFLLMLITGSTLCGCNATQCGDIEIFDCIFAFFGVPGFEYNNTRFDDEWIIGKTSKEIEEKYGAFDRADRSKKDGDYYRNASCGYAVEPYKNFADLFALKDNSEAYYVISFNEDAIACKITKNVVPKGG